MNTKLLATLGMTRKANKLFIGETLLKEISKNNINLVIIATDASDNSKKALINKCSYYKTKYVIILSKREIAKAISKSLVSGVGISDKNFAIKFENIMKVGDVNEK